MHLVADQVRSLDEVVQAIDLGQTPGDVVFLSFSDSDLGLVQAAHRARETELPSLRIASLADLRHPYSVDLWLEQVGRHARFILVRLLGGADYWRYGVDELATTARARGIGLAIVPGDALADERLNRASTLEEADLKRLWDWFREGGPENIASALGWIASRLGRSCEWREPGALPAHGTFGPACRPGEGPMALVVFYRSFVAAADTAPIERLADALAERGFRVHAEYVTSLKDERVVVGLSTRLSALAPAIVINTTAFSARLDDGSTVLETADVPVLQAILSTAPREAWEGSTRGLSAADLAMNVVLPEIDGRIAVGAVSFKGRETRSSTAEHARAVHVADPDGIERVADLAQAWVRLASKARRERRLALVVSDYPSKGGRTAYAVGLDTPASVVAIAEDLRAAGYDLDAIPSCDAVMRALERRGAADAIEAAAETLSLAAYEALYSRLPEPLRLAIEAAWGAPETDPALTEGSFRFATLQLGRLTVAVQPDRGRRDERKSDHHDTSRAPRHAYVAFYLWLREVVGIDAMIHLGTHGTLEWLPGKAAAPSAHCAPSAVLGPVPVVYPFVVNNPGEAAQAKRRIAAVTIGHMTPPLARAGSHGAAAEIEALLDEFSQAQTLDGRRAKMLAATILERARETGLAAESGIPIDADEATALTKLDAWLCDLKDARIADGLHVFARAPSEALLAASIEALTEGRSDVIVGLQDKLEANASAERRGLLRALDGRFVSPGPAGAPSRGRLDVLPTGRNLYAVDPRGIPTRTAWEIGRRTAEDVVARHVQEHGEWPERIVLDLWGSATMRTGGDDLAQALALMGVRPVWDAATARVSGFEILVPAKLGRPRVDVTLRVSGLFRDVFETQISLFDRAARAVADLDEADEDNPAAAARRRGEADDTGGYRVFGAAPGAYGVGLSNTVALGSWETRADLGRQYLAATSHAYGSDASAGVEAAAAFEARVATADAFVHVQDTAEQDVLDSDAFSEHEGGFAAAAQVLGNSPALYHADTTRAGTSKVRTLKEEIARVVRSRATNPRWLAGQMRHGHRGAAEIAETIGNLLAFAATTDEVAQTAFDLVFDATLGDDLVRDFMIAANPAAAEAAARSFDEALRRDLWITRRNSVAGRIAETLEASR